MADEAIVLTPSGFDRISRVVRIVEGERAGRENTEDAPQPMTPVQWTARVTGVPFRYQAPGMGTPGGLAFRLFPAVLTEPDLTTANETWIDGEVCWLLEVNGHPLDVNRRYRVWPHQGTTGTNEPIWLVDVGNVPRYFYVTGRAGVEGNRTYTMLEMMMMYNQSGASSWQLLPDGIAVGPTASPVSFARLDVTFEVGDPGFKYDPTGKVVTAVLNRRPKLSSGDPDQWDILQVLTVSMVDLVTVATCQANETLLSRTRKFACPGGMFVDEPHT